MQMEGKIFGVHIPMEDVMEIKSGKKQVVKRKQFPGYLLVRWSTTTTPGTWSATRRA